MSLLSAELAATCNALGYYDEKTKKYYADENTLETVKDLIRYLRRDDENHDIRRQLGESKVLQTDLLPLVKTYWEQTELFDVALRLLVNLSTPPLILWNEEVPTDKNVRNYFMQIQEHLQSYKLSFADDALWAVLSSRLSRILETDYVERGEDNSLIIERILVLIRNILYVPIDTTIEKRPDNDANTHDQVSWTMHQSGILDILLYISSSPSEHVYHMHVLEILSYLLREQNPSELGKTELQRNHAEKVKAETELIAMRHKETIQRQNKVKSFSGARHSRFGGTYVVKTMKSISDNDLIYHKPLSRLEALSFDVDKQKPKTPKNRVPYHMQLSERRSAFPIRLFLKEFCVEFLNGAYNTLMYHVKDQLVRAKSHSHDASYYLWALKFFMEFNRAYKFEVKLVSETVSIQTFHYVQQQMENYFDMIQTDKKKIRSWSRRLHFALLAYRELLFTLCFMDKSPDGTVRDSGKVIKSNIFYVLEYRELVLTLLVTYDELKMSDQYLKDLIETQHIFLRSFESFCKDGSIIVQQKSKAKKKKKPIPRVTETPELQLDRQWDEASQQISLVLEANANIPTVAPFDAASEVPIDEQKSQTMINIQRKLRNGEYETSIGLLRAAREVWPENDSFGSNDMSPEEEFIALRDIFMADLGENAPVQQEPIYDENDEEEDEDDEGPGFGEGDLKFEDFAKRLAHPKVVRAAALALSKFEDNSVHTNHCILKLMHRIAFDSKMYVMFFQVSLFVTFRKIYNLKEMPEYKELLKFVNYILRQFLKIAETNKKIFMEALFWKSTKDAYDIEFGYGSYQERTQSASKAWTEEEEDEVRRLFMEHKEKQLEDDVVDWIQSNLIDNTRTRRGVLKKLKELYLLTDYKGKKKVRNTNRLQQHWDEEEEEQLRELYEHFKDAMDPLGCIMDRLNVPRPKNRIIEKLLVLGLIQDRKEVQKKRVKNSSRSGSGKSRHQQQNSDGDSDSSEDDYRSNLRSNINGQSRQKKTDQGNSLVISSPRVLAELTLKILESGMREALEWLKESFSDAIEDFEEDNEEGIPLVPIMDYAVSAMENGEFQNLLQSMGISKPLNEQEAYWRIPCQMTLEMMKNHQELLTKALEGSLIIPPEIDVPIDQTESAMLPNDESSDEDIFTKLRSISNTQEPTTSTENPPTRKRRRILSSETNSEAENNEELENTEELRESRKSKVVKKKRIVHNSDDDDIEDALEIAEERLKKQRKKKSDKPKDKNTGTKEGKPKKKSQKKADKPEKSGQNFISKEFISTDDDSSDDGESERRVQEYYEKQLRENVEITEKKKVQIKMTKANESTSEHESEEENERNSEQSTDEESDKENVDCNEEGKDDERVEKVKKKIFDESDDE